VKRTAIVPFFIPHQGCPHRCVYCDQRTVTGRGEALPTAATLLATVAEYRRTSGGGALEVAFYGGTFTALSRQEQESLLRPLQPLLTAGEVASVRVSTRPDAISADGVALLAEHGVGLVELGVQSLTDPVLARSGRGYDAAAVERAFAVLRAAGLSVGAQLMPGLPGDSRATVQATMTRIVGLEPALLRIYPTLVLAGTHLAELYQEGDYRPLTLAEAVDLCKEMVHTAAIAGIPVVRVGLQPTTELAAPGAVVAGPFHPAFRQLVEGERWFDLLTRLAAGFPPEGTLTIRCPAGRESDVAGHRRHNLQRLAALHGRRVTAVTADPALAPTVVRLTGSGGAASGDLLRDLSY
jgi:histone acetyltransferase (RNA polymerase elongator complex component)